MTDPPVVKLADLLVNYSLELKPGQIVRLDGGTVAAPFVRELYRAALRAGAYPRTRRTLRCHSPSTKTSSTARVM